MYAKLAIRNMKRNARDYLIYLVTLILCISLFYAFLSISSSYYNPSIGTEFDINFLSDGMKVTIVLITLILLFLVKYVNNYMIKRKQKEFAIQTMMGMEQKTTALLFFIETLIMGLVAIVIGILVGTFISQIITSIIVSSFNQEFKIYFSLFPDTAVITIVFFMLLFCIIGFFNIKTISKIKIIDMLNSSKQVENDLKKDKLIPIFIILSFLLSCIMLLVSVNLLKLYDSRFDIITKVTLIGNIVAPIIFIIACSVYFIKRKDTRKTTYYVAILSVISIFLAAFSISMNSFLSHLSNEIVDISIKNIYFLFTVIFLIFSVFGIFFCISGLVLFIKNNYVKIKYKNENLFLFGQLIDKLKSNSKTMSIVSITLAASMIALILGPLLSSWSMGYLDKRAVFDIQIATSYVNIETIEALPKINYNFVIKGLEENNYKVDNYVQIESYFLNEKDFYKRYKADFPILCISLSDYNSLRYVAGLEEIELGENEFTTQWYETALNNEIDEFMSNNTSVNVGENILMQSKNSVYQDSLSGFLYNKYTDLIYVVPDKACENLLTANISFYANTAEALPYNIAKDFKTYIDETLYELTDETWVYVKTVERNNGISGVLMIKLLLMYLGITLIIICFTVLSLQQLSDAYDFKYRFNVLNKLGVSETGINTIIKRQMGFWFGAPILTAIIITIIIISYVIKSNLPQFLAYTGVNILITNITGISTVILIIFICYFTSSLMLFKKNIR